jgi:hypothetical protein
MDIKNWKRVIGTDDPWFCSGCGRKVTKPSDEAVNQDVWCPDCNDYTEPVPFNAPVRPAPAHKIAGVLRCVTCSLVVPAVEVDNGECKKCASFVVEAELEDDDEDDDEVIGSCVGCDEPVRKGDGYSLRGPKGNQTLLCDDCTYNTYRH